MRPAKALVLCLLLLILPHVRAEGRPAFGYAVSASLDRDRGLVYGLDFSGEPFRFLGRLRPGKAGSEAGESPEGAFGLGWNSPAWGPRLALGPLVAQGGGAFLLRPCAASALFSAEEGPPFGLDPALESGLEGAAIGWGRAWGEVAEGGGLSCSAFALRRVLAEGEAAATGISLGLEGRTGSVSVVAIAGALGIEAGSGGWRLARRAILPGRGLAVALLARKGRARDGEGSWSEAALGYSLAETEPPALAFRLEAGARGSSLELGVHASSASPWFRAPGSVLSGSGAADGGLSAGLDLSWKPEAGRHLALSLDAETGSLDPVALAARPRPAGPGLFLGRTLALELLANRGARSEGRARLSFGLEEDGAAWVEAKAGGKLGLGSSVLGLEAGARRTRGAEAFALPAWTYDARLSCAAPWRGGSKQARLGLSLDGQAGGGGGLVSSSCGLSLGLDLPTEGGGEIRLELGLPHPGKAAGEEGKAPSFALAWKR